jgi:predicted nucleic acid-binding protein
MFAPLLIADSGPLIPLARVDPPHLPTPLYREVLVAAAVWSEDLATMPGCQPGTFGTWLYRAP